jgi:hypothetical protein
MASGEVPSTWQSQAGEAAIVARLTDPRKCVNICGPTAQPHGAGQVTAGRHANRAPPAAAHASTARFSAEVSSVLPSPLAPCSVTFTTTTPWAHTGEASNVAASDFGGGMTMADAIKTVEQLCVENGIDAGQLAERSGLDEQRVAAIVLGRWTPSPQERDSIAACFGLARDQIAWGHKIPVQHLYGQGPT